jgi:pilus assembly protein CpaC
MKKLTAIRNPAGDNYLSSPDPELLALIDALCKDHIAKVRAEPSLRVTCNAPEYMFQGGEQGYRVKDPNGGETIKFKEYGTRADVMATLVPGNRIHMDLRVRLSELDPANSDPDGYSMPSLSSRETELGVTLRSGKTAFLGGMRMQRNVAVNSPSTGSINKSDANGAAKDVHYVSEEVESIIMVKAEIVTKDPRDEKAKADGTAEANIETSKR